MPAMEAVPEVAERPKAGALEKLNPGPTERPLVGVQEDLTSVMIGTVLLEADEKPVAREHAGLKPEPAEMLMTGTCVMLASEVVEELRREDMRGRIGRQ